MFFQAVRGLRPSELLKIVREDVALPSDLQPNIVVRLGARAGTKAKRPHSVLVRESEHGVLLRLLCRLVELTPPRCFLFPISIASYRLRLKQFVAEKGLAIDWSPHSPRAGFATDATADGLPFPVLKEEGRWVSDTSTRVYIDCVSSVASLKQIEAAGYSEAVAYTYQHFEDYFPDGCFDYAAAGVEESRQWALHAPNPAGSAGIRTPSGHSDAGSSKQIVPAADVSQSGDSSSSAGSEAQQGSIHGEAAASSERRSEPGPGRGLGPGRSAAGRGPGRTSAGRGRHRSIAASGGRGRR